MSTATVAAVDRTPLSRIAGSTVRKYCFGESARTKSTKQMTPINRTISDRAIIPAANNNPMPICVRLVCDLGVMVGESVANN